MFSRIGRSGTDPSGLPAALRNKITADLGASDEISNPKKVVPLNSKNIMDEPGKRSTKYSNTFRALLTPFENKVLLIQKLLVWETPHQSWLLVIAANVAFLIFSRMELYSIFGIIGFCYFGSVLWFQHVWPDMRVSPPPANIDDGWTTVHPRLMGVPELSTRLAEMAIQFDNYWERAYNLRKTEPGKFFIYAMMLFAMLAFVGHYIKGLYLGYLLVMACLIVPGLLYHKLLQRVKPVVTNIEKTMNIQRRRSSKKSSESLTPRRQSRSPKNKEPKFVWPEEEEGGGGGNSEESSEEEISCEINLRSVPLKSSEYDDVAGLPSLMPEVTSDNETESEFPSHMTSVPSLSMMDESETLFSNMPSSMDDTSNTCSPICSEDNSMPSDSSQLFSSDSQQETMPRSVTFADQNANNNVGDGRKRSTTGAGQSTSDDDSTLHDLPSLSVTSSSQPILPSAEVAGLSDDSLHFIHQHFKDSSDEGEDDTRLFQGLVFPDVYSLEEDAPAAVPIPEPVNTEQPATSALGLMNTLSQAAEGHPVGAMIAGALSSAQEAVGGTLASQVMANLMQTTVADLTKKLAGNSSVASPASSSHAGDERPPVRDLNQGSSTDSDFEILNADDLEHSNTK